MWVRYTAHKERGEPPHAHLWCTVFDSDRPPLARRTASPAPLGVPASGEWARIDGATIAPGRAAGALEDCAWSVTWAGNAPELPYLPAWLYARPLPRSNGVALVPSATFAGTVDVGADRFDLAAWRGMVGH
ncbi:MAG: hypothetical protein ACRDLS_10705, partial [Solirubrobacteraceae bacterium]